MGAPELVFPSFFLSRCHLTVCAEWQPTSHERSNFARFRICFSFLFLPRCQLTVCRVGASLGANSARTSLRIKCFPALGLRLLILSRWQDGWLAVGPIFGQCHHQKK